MWQLLPIVETLWSPSDLQLTRSTLLKHRILFNLVAQVQIFNKYGQFLRKFGADVLQHPRGVAVDPWGRIVVVECKVMRVVIFDMQGRVLVKFSCSR